MVTALPAECEAVLRHLSALRREEHPQGNRYPVGEFQAGDHRWEVLVVEAGHGNPAAAVETERALQHFEPEVALFVGVGGGVKDTSRGDLVVATLSGVSDTLGV